MKSFVAAAAVVGLAAALPQPEYTPSGTFSSILPKATAGSDCSTNYDGTFEIQVVNATTNTKVKRQSGDALSISLENGILTDSKGRIGYIASNDQFQFDFGGQAGEKYTAGWAVCKNNTLALGADAIFYKCLSGTFYNLYDENDAAQCSAVYIEVINTSGASASVSGAATQLSDGQVTASPVTQITDGQIQATTGVPVTQITDGQIQATTGVPVTQIGDGQIQATTGTATPVTQISDGQIQATTGVPVTQISDGQIQATTGTPVTQIGDGQIQAATGTPVTQISDGQIQASATNGTRTTSASPSVVAFTGAAAPPHHARRALRSRCRCHGRCPPLNSQCIAIHLHALLSTSASGGTAMTFHYPSCL